MEDYDAQEAKVGINRKLVDKENFNPCMTNELNMSMNSFKATRKGRIQDELNRVKNKNKRTTLELQQLGKDITDNVLAYHKSGSIQKKVEAEPNNVDSRKKFIALMNKKLRDNKKLKDPQQIHDEYEKMNEKIDNSMADVFEAVDKNQGRKSWNSVNMSVKRSLIFDIVRKRNMRKIYADKKD